MKILVNIDVNNLEAGIQFYNALGFRLNRRIEKGFAEMKGGSTPVSLLREKQKTRAVSGLRIKRNYSRHWTPVHLDFVVPDIRKAVRKAIGAGAKLEGRIRKPKYGYLATLSDPFGNGFCFIQFTGHGYDDLTG